MFAVRNYKMEREIMQIANNYKIRISSDAFAMQSIKSQSPNYSKKTFSINHNNNQFCCCCCCSDCYCW